MQNTYPSQVEKLLTEIQNENTEAIEQIVSLTKNTVDSGGIVFVFGSGHSCVLAIEAFHRAGGLIPVVPILYDFLTPLQSPKISGKMERLEGVAPILFARSGARSGDMIWIVSNSGINAASIEMAIEAKKNGVKSIALTSLKHSKSTSSRHPSGKKLFELCDFVLDNHCPSGDGLVSFGSDQVGAGSTIANAYLYNWVLSRVCELWHREGKKLPVYRSANLPGSDDHNEKMEAPYKARIPLL